MFTMSHRTQITLTDDQYALLVLESRRSGSSLAELIRRAVARVYGSAPPDSAGLPDVGFGAWRGRDFTGEEYVERIRRPGLGNRLLR